MNFVNMVLCNGLPLFVDPFDLIQSHHRVSKVDFNAVVMKRESSNTESNSCLGIVLV